MYSSTNSFLSYYVRKKRRHSRFNNSIIQHSLLIMFSLMAGSIKGTCPHSFVKNNKTVVA